MTLRNREPVIRVGLVTGAAGARFRLEGSFRDGQGHPLASGDYRASKEGSLLSLDPRGRTTPASSILIEPSNFDACRFTVSDVTIGIGFHWERREAQTFQGSLALVSDHEGLTLINELPLESYLVSVISSEMSASCPSELLRAHAIVSRSWLLANLDAARGDDTGARSGSVSRTTDGSTEVIRWYGRESHTGFDVCADDHCQRYQGITKAFSQSAFEAAGDTRGRVLTHGDEVCDARYSKSCGGMTEVYSAAWDDRDMTYLRSVYDGPGAPGSHALPLTDERNAERWITSSPPSHCNTDSRELLERILPGFDLETKDFYRWRVEYSNDDLSEIIRLRTGVDVGRLVALEPLERGQSGRIIRLKITGDRQSLVIGKELEIRRALSQSHLYSSAFVVRPAGDGESMATSKRPERFTLIGAGWGHGVGLCQIGAAVMAGAGESHENILAHYFHGAVLRTLY